ncbi:thiamine biosynthesis protein ApbE [Rhodobacter sp.]
MAALLPDGRLHLQHGPIDIVAQGWGDPTALRAGYARAAARFSTILQELVPELPALRAEGQPVSGVVAGRMAAAVAPFRPAFITPMAAVAGAVAEEVLAALLGPGIRRAQVNNGGDIALWLAPGESLRCALAVSGGMDHVTVWAGMPVRGIATSGWRGRSFSLGIADAVTVLARTAAMADAAATMIANAVDLPGHPGIHRRPAHELQLESDLGARLVTVAVPDLSRQDRQAALAAGLAAAEGFRARGLIEGAAIYLQGRRRLTGGLALTAAEGGNE